MVLIQKRKPENALTLYCRHLKETKKFGRKIIANKDSNLTINLNPRVRVPQQHMRAYQIITVGNSDTRLIIPTKSDISRIGDRSYRKCVNLSLYFTINKQSTRTCATAAHVRVLHIRTHKQPFLCRSDD